MITTKKMQKVCKNATNFYVSKNGVKINGITLRVESTKIIFFWSESWKAIGKRLWGDNPLILCKNLKDAFEKIALMTELGRYENGMICA